MLCLLKLCFWPRAKTLLLRGIRKCSAARWPTGSIRALLSATRHSRVLQHHQPNSSSFGSFQDLLYRRLLHLLRRHIHLPPIQCHNTDRQLVQTTHLLLQYLRCVLDTAGIALNFLRVKYFSWTPFLTFFTSET